MSPPSPVTALVQSKNSVARAVIRPEMPELWKEVPSRRFLPYTFGQQKRGFAVLNRSNIMARSSHERTDTDLIALARALCGTSRDDPGALIASRPGFLRTAELHLVLPALASAPGAPLHDSGPVGATLAAVAGLNADRNQRILADLEHVLLTLNREGLKPVLVKGIAHLAMNLWPAPGARMVRDVDILLPRDDTARANDILVQTLDFTPARQSRNAQISPSQKHLPPLYGKALPVGLELHHSVLPDQGSKLIDTERLLAHAQPCQIGRAEALVPCPSDLALIALAHGPVGSSSWAAPQIYLRDLLDLVFLARTCPGEIDWPQIAARCEAEGWAFLPAWANLIVPEFCGMAPLFPQMGRAARLDAQRWRRQLDIKAAVRLGRFANLAASTLSALKAGGPSRQAAINALLQSATYRRAFRRYLTGADEAPPEMPFPK